MGEMSAYKEDIHRVFQNDLPWRKLSDCNILVTGATGLIGGCLIEALMENPNKDYQVYASGRNESRARLLFNDYANSDSFHFLKNDENLFEE